MCRHPSIAGDFGCVFDAVRSVISIAGVPMGCTNGYRSGTTHKLGKLRIVARNIVLVCSCYV